MARDLASFCPTPAELIIVPKFTHNQPFRKPDLTFWGPVIDRIVG
jgi:hypothetical protein